MTEAKKLAEMTASELKAHIEALERQHRNRMRHLRALLRALEAEEQS